MKEEYEDFAKYGIMVGVISLILASNLPEWVEELVPWAKGLIEWVVYFIASSFILVSLVFIADTLAIRHRKKKEEKNKPRASFTEKFEGKETH